MKNREIADIFAQMADILEMLGEDTFRINSYRRAARTVGELSTPIEELAQQGKLQEVPGVGKSTAEKIQQYLATGKIDRHQELLTQVPPSLPKLLAIPGMGPKTAVKLWKEAGITSLDDLKKAFEAQDERLKAIHGLGPKKVRQIWEGLMFVQSSGQRIRLGDADSLARDLVEAVKKAGGRRVEPAGSLRRGRETVGDLDLLCEAPARSAGKIIQTFVSASNVRKVLGAGTTKGSVVLVGDVQADLRVVEKKSLGAALAYFTGSKAHNIRLRELAVRQGLKLNEYGLFRGEESVAGADEEGLYKALGLAFVPPELREDRGEVEAALEHRLPGLVDLSDIRGDFHMHTIASDGANTIQEMIDGCRQRKYVAMAICDHSRSQTQANGLDEERMLRHVAEIRQAARGRDDILVLAGSEVDILKDGSLDYSDEALAELDFVVASMHSYLTMESGEATRRVIRAIEHPLVNCIGHPSGRLINARPGVELDIDAIAQAAAAHDVALEINAHYMRLDLRDTHVRSAIEHGAKILIGTDAHDLEELHMMRYGVLTARRGWATPNDVINTWGADRIRQWLARKRPEGKLKRAPVSR